MSTLFNFHTHDIAPFPFTRRLLRLCVVPICKSVSEYHLPVLSVDGVWSDWSDWSQCNVSCGGGSSSRTRTCSPPQYGGAACNGSSTEAQICNTKSCAGNNLTHLILRGPQLSFCMCICVLYLRNYVMIL